MTSCLPPGAADAGLPKKTNGRTRGIKSRPRTALFVIAAAQKPVVNALLYIQSKNRKFELLGSAKRKLFFLDFPSVVVKEEQTVFLSIQTSYPASAEDFWFAVSPSGESRFWPIRG